MENFIITITYLIIGVFLKTTKKLPENFSSSLNLFVIYVSLPALVLIKIPFLEIGHELLFVAILPWIMVALGSAMVLLFSRIFRWKRDVTGCLLLMVALGNTSFLGIPMVRAFFGEDAVAYAVIYDQLGSFLALSTYGSVVLAFFASKKDINPNFQDIVIKILTFPPFIALVLAFLLRSIAYPALILRILDSLGSTLVPVVMIAVGYQLCIRLEASTVKALMVGLFMKLCVSPILALVVVKLVGLHGDPVRVAIFEAGMPPMVSAGALAIMADLSPRLTAALVGAGILLSFLSLPVLFEIISYFV